ncbi:DAK2 domain-containing protein [Nitrosomonas ureae]|nr:DAK2 domain-containing protein [Nitrosomonas ureae]
MSEELGRLDAIAGDGDHGIGMQRGITAAVAAAKEARVARTGVGTLLKAAGDAWSDRAGGTSGALWGIILHNLGDALGDKITPDASAVAVGIASALRDVINRGKAQLGDKTLVDVLHPFSAALTTTASQGLSIVDSWAIATDIANEAAQATKNLRPRIGRARPHAEQSLGTPDPGAISLALIIRAIEKTLNHL